MAAESDTEVKTEVKTAEEPLYYTKDGKPQFGITAPSAFAFSCPHPPLPFNLSKNRVLRAVDDQTKESLQEGITEAEKDFEKEAMPLPTLTGVNGLPLSKSLIPEIELAIYWDRHPYEFRSEMEKEREKQKNSSNSMRRSKSETNLASKEVRESLRENSHSSHNGSKSSRKSSANSMISMVSGVSSTRNMVDREKSSRNNNHCDEQSPNNHGQSNQNSIPKSLQIISNAGSVHSGEQGNSVSNNSVASFQMTKNGQKKFEDIKHFHQQNNRNKNHGSTYNRPKIIRSKDQLDSSKKSTGIQVTLEDAAAAALKSTYLCPLHGQYRRGIERREKGGFRTDMSSVQNVTCSRALKGIPSRTKLIKTTETQTDDEIPLNGNNAGVDSRAKRSKTAGHGMASSRRGKDIMASEYHGSFKDPYKIADAEKRHLRNKILNYCFTKHSVF
ncbi:unnamed protein product [Orchesella dallaii]|uniref:Uncharacterized protein n=1 Tax=Orchesella dallaii TaxID=48710 RepID=A0ABP1QL24_9HEXA